RVHECALDRMKPVAIVEGLDGLNAPSRCGRAEHETRAHEVAVHDDRARPTLALLARIFAPGKAEAVAKDGQKTLVVRRFGLALVAVHRELDPQGIAATRARARAPMIASTCRRYAAVPRTSSIGFAAPAASRPNSCAAASVGLVGRSHPVSSKRPAAKRSASAARMIVGPQEPRPTPTRRRARATTSASPEMEMAIALRVAAHL